MPPAVGTAGLRVAACAAPATVVVVDAAVEEDAVDSVEVVVEVEAVDEADSVEDVVVATVGVEVVLAVRDEPRHPVPLPRSRAAKLPLIERDLWSEYAFVSWLSHDYYLPFFP